MKPARFHFPKRCRLISAADYQRVFSKPLKSSDSYFTLYMRKNRLVHARLGFAVSRKQIKKAVNRNRLKRVVRESFRLQQEKLLNFDIVVIAHAKAACAGPQDIRKYLEKHWEKITCGVSRSFPL